MAIDNVLATRRAKFVIARRRGALSGIALIVLGAWGALIPFIGPSFHYGYLPDRSWYWTTDRGWLEVLPGAAAAVGGLLILVSSRRAVALFGAWLAAAAGAWFVVGPSLTVVWHIGSAGQPISARPGIAALETIGMFTGLGALIVFVAGTAFGRLSVRSLADIRSAQRTIGADELAVPADGVGVPADGVYERRGTTTEPVEERRTVSEPVDAGRGTTTEPVEERRTVSEQRR